MLSKNKKIKLYIYFLKSRINPGMFTVKIINFMTLSVVLFEKRNPYQRQDLYTVLA